MPERLHHGPVIAKAPSFAPLTLARRAPPFPFGRPEARLTHSARAAIFQGLKALGIGKGARILVPAWHCGSEVDAVIAAGCTPVLYGLDESLRADLDQVEALMRPGAAAVYTIHYFGCAQPVAALAALAQRHGAVLIEDVALGLYSTDGDGRPLGTAGAMSVFSLVKTLGVPDGGVLWLARGGRDAMTLRPPPARRVLSAVKALAANRRRQTVRDAAAGAGAADLDRWDPAAGLEPRDASLACSRLTRGWLALADHERVRRSRRLNYEALEAAIRSRPGPKALLGPLPEGACPAYFPLLADDVEPACRALAEAGIEPVRFWRRPHPSIDLSAFPRLAALRRQVIRLPVHEGIGPVEICRIADALARVAV